MLNVSTIFPHRGVAKKDLLSIYHTPIGDMGVALMWFCLVPSTCGFATCDLAVLVCLLGLVRGGDR